MPSGGLSITWSPGARPAPITARLPSSRSTVTGLNVTRSPAPSVATRMPLPLKTSALDGTLRSLWAAPRSRSTLAKPPGISSPLPLSTSSCISVVPLAALTEPAESSTVAV